MFSNHRSLLHVDDDSLFTQLVEQHFNRAGYESVAVNDPLDAIKTMIRGQHRVVVLDVQMPNKSGLQLLQEIKQYDAGIRVILLTSVIQEATMIEAIRLGAEACFLKPLVDSKPLLDAVEEAFRINERWWDTMRDLENQRKSRADAAEV